MADDRPAPGPSLFERTRHLRPGPPGLALLAAAIALVPPLVAWTVHPATEVAPPARPRPAGGSALPLQTLLAHVAARLPRSDRLHLAALDDGGGLLIETETSDPEALRAAFAGDPLLRGLATVAETIRPDGGMRVRMARPGIPAAAAPPATIDPRSAGLLVERSGREVAVSGAEPAVLALVARLNGAREPIGLSRWRIEAAGGGAVRLTGSPVRLPDPVAAAIPSRALFPDTAPAIAADAPDLIGIVGRLGRDAVALVREPDGGVATVAVGGSAGGWRLETLSADAALFSRDGERARVAVPAD